MATHLDIVDGPSKYELMLGLFDSATTRPRPVEFRLSRRVALEAHIQSVSREDGSGESWNLEGWVVSGEVFDAYFNTKRRTGHIHLHEDAQARREFTGCIGYADAPPHS